MNAINYISHDFGMKELTDDEVMTVSGGHPLIIAAGVAAGAAGLWTAGGTIGKSIGVAIYNLLH